MRVLLDNDVVLDFVLQRQPFYAEAEEIFLVVQTGEFTGYISDITPINAFYTTRKEIAGKDVAFKAVEGLMKIVESLHGQKNQFCKMLYTRFYGL